LEEELKEKNETKQKLELIVSRIEEYEKSKKRLEDLNEKREEIEKRLRNLEEMLEGKNLEECRKKLTELVGTEKELESKIEGIKQLVEEKNQRLEEEKQKLENVEKQKEEIAKLEKIIKNLQIFERALEETQNQLRKEFVEAVNYTMNQLWSTLYPYGDFTNIALNIENGDYVLQLKDRMNRWVNVEGIVSGGERSIACLSLRIAFALVLAPHLKLLILDEPTANLDSRAIQVLASVLREKINEFIEQTFLITHQKELEDAVSGAYYILERDKEKGETTKVSLGY
jgi:exonuclease SbcC